MSRGRGQVFLQTPPWLHYPWCLSVTAQCSYLHLTAGRAIDLNPKLLKQRQLITTLYSHRYTLKNDNIVEKFGDSLHTVKYFIFFGFTLDDYGSQLLTIKSPVSHSPAKNSLKDCWAVGRLEDSDQHPAASQVFGERPVGRRLYPRNTDWKGKCARKRCTISRDDGSPERIVKLWFLRKDANQELRAEMNKLFWVTVVKPSLVFCTISIFWLSSWAANHNRQ